MSILSTINFQLFCINSMFDLYNVLLKSLSYKIRIYIMEYIDNFRSVNDTNKNTNDFLTTYFNSKLDYIQKICPTKSSQNLYKNMHDLDSDKEKEDGDKKDIIIDSNQKVIEPENNSKQSHKDNMIQNDFSMENYSMFIKFFLNNNFKFINAIQTNNDSTHRDLGRRTTYVSNSKPSYKHFRASYQSKIFTVNKNSFIRENKTLDIYLKNYFGLKAVLLRYFNFTSSVSKKICSMCEKNFSFEDYIIHYFFCKSRMIYIQMLSEVKDDFKHALSLLKVLEKKRLYNENVNYGVFSKGSNFNAKLKNSIKNNEKDLFVYDDEESTKLFRKKPKDILDYFIYIITAEETKSNKFYEDNPSKLLAMNRLINFSIKIFINNNQNIRNNDFSKINEALKLIILSLIKKEYLVVNIILDNEKLMNLISKKKNFTSKRDHYFPNSLGREQSLPMIHTNTFQKIYKLSDKNPKMLTDKEKFEIIYNQKMKHTTTVNSSFCKYSKPSLSCNKEICNVPDQNKNNLPQRFLKRQINGINYILIKRSRKKDSHQVLF